MDDAPDTDEVEELSRTTAGPVPPNKIVFGHLDDAIGTNLIQYDQNRLFVARSDLAGTPVMHHYFRTNISSLIVGDFALSGSREHGHDQVCARLVDGVMECYAPSDDRSELWYWFAQLDPLQSGEQAIIGDFTGDGADDLLAFSSSAGTVRLLSRTQYGYFAVINNWAPGSLGSIDLHGKRLYAGEFGLATGRTDLLVVDPTTGIVRRYDTIDNYNGQPTFSLNFTSHADAVASTDQLTVANIEGGDRDGLFVRDSVTGAIQAVRATTSGGYLEPIPASLVSVGQIPITTDAATLVAVKYKTNAGEPGPNRDDTFFFNRTTGTVTETSARWDGAKFTYWYAWRKGTPTQTGWPARRDPNLIILYCRTADHADFSPSQTALNNVILGRGTGGVRDLVFESTYGIVDIANATTKGWVTSALKASDSSSRVAGGWTTPEWISSCKTAANISPTWSGYTLVVMNEPNVAYQGFSNLKSASVEYDSVLAGQVSSVAHELMHAFGLGHANDDSFNVCNTGSPMGEYCDPTDFMGNYNSVIFTGGSGYTGPQLNAGHRLDLDALPDTRVVTLDAATSATTTTLDLSALEQPEAQGPLVIELVNGSTTYTVAYRRKVGLDRNLPADAVQVHMQGSNNATLLSSKPSQMMKANTSKTVGPFFLQVGTIGSRATVTVTILR